MSHQVSKKFFVADDADTYPSGEAAPNLPAGPSTGPPTTIQTPSGSFTKLPSVSSLLKLAGVALDDKPSDLPPPGSHSRTSLIRSMGQGGSSQSVPEAILASRASQADMTSVREAPYGPSSGATAKQRAAPQSTPATYSYECPPQPAQVGTRQPQPQKSVPSRAPTATAPILGWDPRSSLSKRPTHSSQSKAQPSSARADPRPHNHAPSHSQAGPIPGQTAAAGVSRNTGPAADAHSSLLEIARKYTILERARRALQIEYDDIRQKYTQSQGMIAARDQEIMQLHRVIDGLQRRLDVPEHPLDRPPSVGRASGMGGDHNRVTRVELGEMSGRRAHSAVAVGRNDNSDLDESVRKRKRERAQSGGGTRGRPSGDGEFGSLGGTSGR